LDGYFTLIRRLRAGSEVTALAPRNLGVTSATRGVGVSTVARSLAIAAARMSSRPVLLLDLSRVELAGFAEPHSTHAQDQHAAQQAQLELRDRVVPSSGAGNLFTLELGEGGTLSAAFEDFGIADWLRWLEQDFGFVVVDLPPAQSAMCFAAAGLLNGVLLVVEAGRTSSESAARGKLALDEARGHVLGVILNKQR
jgi:Mrp family chromosome partitioning ATPase